MIRYLIPIVALAALVYGFIDCVRTDSRAVRGIPKAAWIIIILILPLVGVLLWFLLGRPRYAAESTSVRWSGPTTAPRSTARSGPVAPDDDPEFLRNLETARRNKAEAERLRQLKAELEAREARLREQQQNGEQA